MSARKMLVWVVVGGVSLMLCAGCRPRTKSDVRHYRQVIRQLDEKSGRLALENSTLRAKLDQSKLMIEMLKNEGGVLGQLNEDLKRKLIEIMEGELPGMMTLDSKGTISLAGKVLFKSGHYEVRPAGKTLLKKIAGVLKDEDAVLRIDGHTDNVRVKYAKRRGIKDNRHLSAMRAYSVIKVLRQSGVDPRRLFLSGYGEYWPVADNDTKEGRQKNRRVDIVVLPPRAISIPDASAAP